MPSTPIVAADADELARVAAAWMAEEVRQAAARGGRCALALSGGATPRPAYERLAREPGLPWAAVEIYFGDERAVPPTDPASNFRMAREALIDRVGLPAERVHRMEADAPDLEAAAARYAAWLPERVDVLVLGMGPDGHTASLFPGTAVLDDTRSLAAAVYVPRLESWRVTLTAPVLSAASHLMVTVVGAEKADALATALSGPPGAVPISLVQAPDMRWLVDAAAAQKWRARG